MALRTYDGQSASLLRLGGQLNVCSSTRHVGGNSHCGGKACLGHNLGFTLVLLGVQHVVLNLPYVEHPAQNLGDFHRGGTHQHGSTGLSQGHYFVDHRIKLLTHGFVDLVFHVFSDDGPVGRDNDHIKFVDFPKLTCFSFGRAGHARQLVVHPEIVLQGDGGVGLGGIFHRHIFFGLNGLMQPVGIAAAFHHTTRLLVNYFDLAVHYHIFCVFFKQRVGLEELVNGVDPLRLDLVVFDQHFLLLQDVNFSESSVVFQLSYFQANVWHDKEVGVFTVAGNHVHSLFCQLNRVVLFFNGE